MIYILYWKLVYCGSFLESKEFQETSGALGLTSICQSGIPRVRDPQLCKRKGPSRWFGKKAFNGTISACLKLRNTPLFMCWIVLKKHTYAFAWYVYIYRHGNDTGCLHDDVIKWKHFPRYWPFVCGIHRSSLNSPQNSHCRRVRCLRSLCAGILDYNYKTLLKMQTHTHTHTHARTHTRAHARTHRHVYIYILWSCKIAYVHPT